MSEHDATAAMVQEAVAPPSDIGSALRVLGDPSLGDAPWQMPVPPGAKRPFASAVAVRSSLPIHPWSPAQLAVAAYGAPVISHPGQWVAVGIGEGRKSTWVVSLYGLWETSARKGIYADATLHRSISDLAVLFQTEDAERIVVAGDLNVWRGYGDWRQRYDSVFDRLAAHGLQFAGPKRTEGSSLERCPCEEPSACCHVQTYRRHRKPDSTPYQNDFAFARGMQVARCTALDEERYWQHSDHCPILIELKEP
jgi:hypothetical protein